MSRNSSPWRLSRARLLGSAFPSFSTELLRLVAAASLAMAASPAMAGPVLPTGGSVAAGSASIGAPTGNALTISQSSQRAIINWGSFSIGAGGLVQFNNGQGATLNRVTGGNLSQIDGSLNATGSVYLGYNTKAGNIQASSASGNNPSNTSSASGSVDGSGDVGGFVGLNNGSLSSDNEVQLTVGDASITAVGGFVGENAVYGTITGGSANDTVTIGKNYVGGFAGFGYGAITNSSVVTETAPGAHSVSGQNYIGGFAGWNGPDATIKNSTASDGIAGSVPVSGTGSAVGGFVGWNQSALLGDQSSDAVSAAEDVGGLVGFNSGAIMSSSASGPTTVDGPNAGGLVGYNDATGGITDSYATGSVTGGPNGNNGGLVGYNLGTIDQSYATGAVSGVQNVGGLVGLNGGSVVLTYATGAVSGGVGGSDIGGLVGTNTGGFITESYAVGAVSGGSNLGGLVGDNVNSGTIAKSYWDTQTAIVTVGIGSDTNGQSGNVHGLTTTQLQSGLPAGFSPSVWGSSPGINDGLPYLIPLTSSY
jgi:filamentous hemagglutinin family protein